MYYFWGINKKKINHLKNNIMNRKILAVASLGLLTMCGLVQLVKYSENDEIKYICTDIDFEYDGIDDNEAIENILEYSSPLDEEDLTDLLTLFK